MLPKKKRWMAAAHTTSVTNLTSSHLTVTTMSNVGSKKLCCDTPMQTIGSFSRLSIPNSITSQIPVNNKTLPTGNLLSAGDQYGLSMLQQYQQQQQQQSFTNRSTSNVTSEYIHSDSKAQTVVPRQSNHPIRSTMPGHRNDANSNLITTFSHYPAELLQQQPGLLLQVLPQEYLANYAQNLAKLSANKNSGDPVHPQPDDCSVGSKINKVDSTSLSPNSGYSQSLFHQPDTQGRQIHASTHGNSPNLPLRIKSPDNSKIQRTPQSLRSSPMLNSPVFQYPAVANSQRFSPPPHPPPRCLSGSSDQTRHAKPMTQNHQLPAGFDLPTISAVARAASMLSPSQLEAAAALLSHWDNANQLALLTNNPSYKNLCNIADSLGSKQPINSAGLSFFPTVSSESIHVTTTTTTTTTTITTTSSNYIDSHTQITSRSGITTDCKSRRLSDLSFTNPRTVPSVSTGTLSDLRCPSMKTSPLPRSMDQLTNRLTSRSSTPVNEPLNKCDHMCCPPWLTTDKRNYSIDLSHSNRVQPSPHDPTVELADSRLAILHDAKLASLSVDWPSCTMNQNIPMSKASRIRSSSSFSPPVCLATCLPSTPESSFSMNQLNAKIATSGSSPSSASFAVTSESLVKSQISSECSSTIPVNFNSKGFTIHTQPSTPSCFQTTKSPSPNNGLTKISNSSQSQLSILPAENSPKNTHSPCGQFGIMNTNPTTYNDAVELSNKVGDRSSNNDCSAKRFTQPDHVKRHHLVGIPNAMPTLLAHSKQEGTRTKFNSDHRSQNISMPLKKRLIQRYEADSVDMKPSDLSICNLAKPEFSVDSSKLQNRSTYVSEDTKNIQYLPENQIAMEASVTEKSDCEEKKCKQNKRTKCGFSGGEMLNSRTNENKSSKIRTKSSSSALKKRGSKGSRRSKHSLNESELGVRLPTMESGFDDVTYDDEEDGENEANKDFNDEAIISKQTVIRQSRKHSSSRNSELALPHSSSLGSDIGRGNVKRRMAAVNGNLMMIVTAHAQRSTSSGSNNSRSSSSSSLRSVDAEVSDNEDDNEACLNSSSSSSMTTDRQLSYSQLQSYKSTLKYMNINSTLNNKHSLTSDESPSTTRSLVDSVPTTVYGSGLRKPKRSASLTGSMLTSNGSSTITAKKPRLSSSSSSSTVTTTKAPTKHRRADTGKVRTVIHKERNPDNDLTHIHFKDELLPNQNDYSPMASGNECTISMSDELSAALAEENLQFEELVKQLPGPPDLNRTANKSLHSTHSLNFYKRSQRVFVQLINCNDPGLKQVPKCRACRQTKVPYNNNNSNSNNNNNNDNNNLPLHYTNGQMDSDDDPENTKLIISDCPSPNDQSISSNGLDKGIHFKKPPGRGTNSDKNKRRESTNDRSKNKRHTAIHSPMSVFCRFWGFRKLCFNSRGVLKIADFCRSTESDALERSLWEMYHPVSPLLSPYAAKYLLECAGGLFCRLLHQELISLNGNHSHQAQCEKINSSIARNGIDHTMEGNKNDGNNSVAWKRPVKGVREMCDVCETTMFNTHWVCGKCGYSVCTDCFNESKLCNLGSSSEPRDNQLKFSENGTIEKGKSKYSRGRGGPHGWASCTTTRQHHDPNKLLLTSLLPSGVIGRLIHRLHRIANYYQIHLGCNCSSSTNSGTHSTDDLLLRPIMKSLDSHERPDRNSLDLLAEIALKVDTANTETLIDGSTGSRSMDNSVILSNVKTEPNTPYSNPSCTTIMDNGFVLLDGGNKDSNNKHTISFPSHSWIQSRNSTDQKLKCQIVNDSTPISTTNTSGDHESDLHRELSNVKYYQTSVGVNHRNPVFLCSDCPDSIGNLLAFQSEWKRNHPLVISGCQRKFSQELWTPQSFSNDFGNMKATLIDCATGAEITRYALKSFWDGFEKRERRITSKDGHPLCLKLKDWPTTDDFAELQPKRYTDLMSNLPMPNYTQRDGQLNLAARLSSFFVCPDLGPKLYVAYGTVGSSSISTTNLHVDIADAVNVMLYVGQPVDSLNEMLTNAESVVNALTSAHVDNIYLDRAVNWLNKIKSRHTNVHNNNSNNTTNTATNTHEIDSEDIPGALWHIFLPEDSTGLREFLSRISEDETGTPVETGSDPIHDQLFYMDQSLLDRLYDCTGIKPYTIVQFHGDAVFIPAGAAHQVSYISLKKIIQSILFLSTFSPFFLYREYRLF
ncbi:Lysine-specific demethylase 3A isoform 1 [Schistosoma japonicum]|uniref:Lysine-specific demethylase 3A isoform 1 n=1 Tax=Schistosoma japonicum TaxID=6182 RepID=A0A4Z2D695_SCHJA|nr:Lysine-specific demethylase 3A isoform 1 [Schistosoma japonicum]